MTNEVLIASYVGIFLIGIGIGWLVRDFKAY